MNLQRAGTIYVKELVDILRDHRTLAAMIIAPIVLYPLLMLGGIQAASSQAEDISDDKIKIGFATAEVWDRIVRPILEEEIDVIGKMQAEAETDEEREAIPEPLGQSVEAKRLDDKLEAAIMNRTVHCGVVLTDSDPESLRSPQLGLTIIMLPEDIRSEMAARRLEEALQRVAHDRRDFELERRGIDPRMAEPILIEFKRIITPGSVLGLILPFILVLMTVTGAIYPAIDLTAGERERGTLESLIVCPVPVLDLVVGKFMAVTTIAIIAAALNIASVTATVFFGGLQEALSPGGEGEEHGFPFWAFPVVLFSLVPFAVLMSAIMIAVCACARTFKEAQNYIMPVIMMVLVPGGIAALPGSQLEGVMVVTPVANMVLLTRDLLSGSTVHASTFIWVIVSTSFYAAVAVGIAAQVFGKESVLFADALSFRALVSRRLIRPQRYPTLSGACLYAAVLFPVWFYAQSSLQMSAMDDYAFLLKWTAILMPLLFVALPWLLLAYWKVDVTATLRLAPPKPRHVIAAILFGVAIWVPAHELLILQQRWIPTPQALTESDQALVAALTDMPVAVALLVLAVVPAFSEELFFRGFLISGLATSLKRWPAIIAAAAVFGAFHFFIFRFAITTSLGIVFGWLCWQSRSIWPAVIAHALYNGLTVLRGVDPQIQRWLGLSESDPLAHVPLPVAAIALACLAVAVFLARRPVPEGT